MRRVPARAFWIVALTGACGFLLALMWADVIPDPPSGLWHAVFWPVDVLLWVSGEGVPLANGGFERTPVQDLACWLGIGASWLFWLGVARVSAWLSLSTARRS